MGRVTGLRGQIVCGRRFCKHCRRWRHLLDFDVSRRWPDDSPRYLFACCKRCELVRKRQGRPPRRFLTPAQRRARHNEYQKRRRRENSLWRSRRQEYERIYKEAQRRRAGVRERPYVTASRAPDVAQRDNVHLPREPFVRWLEKLQPRYESIGVFAEALGLDESLLRRVLRGWGVRRGERVPKPYVSLDTVDRALTSEGSTLLWELYPALYEVPPEEQGGIQARAPDKGKPRKDQAA